MFATTPHIRKKLERAQSTKDRLAVLQDAYAGETLYIFSCGPSFRQHTAEDLVDFSRGKLCLAVKQALDVLGPHADFHLYNRINHKSYRYGRDTIRVFQDSPPMSKVFGPRPHLVLPADPRVFQLPKEELLDSRLMLKRNFDDYRLSLRPERPWGPSILVEVGLFLALHLGVERVRVLGWDLGSTNPKERYLKHFYDTKADLRTRIVNKTCRIIQGFGNRLPFAKQHTGSIVRAVKHHGGLTYNNAPIDPDENRILIEGSGAFYDWLQSQGVQLELASAISHLSPRIPRVALDTP